MSERSNPEGYSLVEKRYVFVYMFSVGLWNHPKTLLLELALKLKVDCVVSTAHTKRARCSNTSHLLTHSILRIKAFDK